MIVTSAGRRIDNVNAVGISFPAENVEKVRQRIRSALVNLEAGALVCAAACGADILALEVAGELGIRRRVVLPYDRESFRVSSVVDCPGDWGGRYDRILAEVESWNDLIVYDYAKELEETYFAVNHDILDIAEELAQELGEDLTALIAWNGESRGDDDVTGHFLKEAKGRGLQVVEISTL